MSLSSWRAWIEISRRLRRISSVRCRSPHGERGLKFVRDEERAERYGRSPHGERGLKLKEEAMKASEQVALLMESVD